ncbi:MAG: hypothetical protein V4754_02375 [Pseudomonadota bacterium]
MNGNIVEMDASEHQRAQKLLPWIVANTLHGADLVLVRGHLRHCQECRDDLAWQRELMAAPPPIQSGPNLERALAAIGGQLDPVPRPSRPRPWAAAWLRDLWHGAGRPQRWAMGLQGAALAGLALALLHQADGLTPAGPDSYRALSVSPRSAPAAQPGNAMVVFKPDTPERELRRILQAGGARIVDGPTVTDAYMLHLPGAARAQAVAALRREPAVLLAESLDGTAR